jgi:hypothetical protein
MRQILTGMALTLAFAAPAAAQTLDTRAASQRACLAEAQAEGQTVVRIDRPVPIMGRLGHVLGETVRMQTAQGLQLRCTYDISEMRAELD